MTFKLKCIGHNIESWWTWYFSWESISSLGRNCCITLWTRIGKDLYGEIRWGIWWRFLQKSKRCSIICLNKKVRTLEKVSFWTKIEQNPNLRQKCKRILGKSFRSTFRRFNLSSLRRFWKRKKNFLCFCESSKQWELKHRRWTLGLGVLRVCLKIGDWKESKSCNGV